MKQVKVVIKRHADGYVAYPLGVKRVIVGEGDTYEEALADVTSRRHIQTSHRRSASISTPSGLVHAFLMSPKLNRAIYK